MPEPEPAGGQGDCVRPVSIQPGIGAGRRPQPLATTALLSFHDAAEMFLGLAADYLGVNLIPRTSTSTATSPRSSRAPGSDLPSRHPMRRMNRSRVNLKHHGLFPSPTDLEQFKGDVTTFLTDATTMVFKGGLSEPGHDRPGDPAERAQPAAERRDAGRSERSTPRRSRCCPRRSKTCSGTTRTASRLPTSPLRTPCGGSRASARCSG